MLRKLHQTLRKITEDFDSRWHFNTSIAAIMELVNELYAEESRISPAAMAQAIELTTLMLAPFSPYIAQELWEEQGHNTPVFKEEWPDFDPDLARETEIEVVVQINGKLRSRLSVPAGTEEENLRHIALADDKVVPMLAGKTILKTVVVPGKLVNFVVK